MCVGPIIIIDESNRANPNIKCVDVTFQQIMMSVLGYNNRKSFYFSDSQSLIFFVGTVLNWYRLLECYRR